MKLDFIFLFLKFILAFNYILMELETIFWLWSTAELVEDVKCQNMILQVGETRGTQLFKKQICSGYRCSFLIIKLPYQSGGSPDPRPVCLWEKMCEVLMVLVNGQVEATSYIFLGGCWLQTGIRCVMCCYALAGSVKSRWVRWWWQGMEKAWPGPPGVVEGLFYVRSVWLHGWLLRNLLLLKPDR